MKATLEQLIWEEAENAASERVGTLQEARAIVADYKPHLTLVVTDVATIPANGGGRPTCEASLVATAEAPINETITLLQRAVSADGNLKLNGKELRGAVSYVVNPTDDGTGFRVSAQGFQLFSMGLAGMASVARLERVQSELVAQGKAKAPLAAAPASATPVASEPASCGTTSADLIECADAELVGADKALNAAYAAARTRLDDGGKTALRDEQRGWIKTRDATCSEAKITADSKGAIAGGSAMALEVIGCKTKLTQERTKQLSAKG